MFNYKKLRDAEERIESLRTINTALNDTIKKLKEPPVLKDRLIVVTTQHGKVKVIGARWSNISAGLEIKNIAGQQVGLFENREWCSIISEEIKTDAAKIQP